MFIAHMFPDMFSPKPLVLSSELAQSALASVNYFHDGILETSKVLGDVLHLKFIEPYFPAQNMYCAFGITGARLEVGLPKYSASTNNDLQVLGQLSDRMVFECIFDSDGGMLRYLDASLHDILRVPYDPNASFIRWF